MSLETLDRTPDEENTPHVQQEMFRSTLSVCEDRKHLYWHQWFHEGPIELFAQKLLQIINMFFTLIEKNLESFVKVVDVTRALNFKSS